MSSPSARQGSFRKGFDKISSSLHIHRQGSLSPSPPTSPVTAIPKACHNDEEAACLNELCAELQKRGITVPSDMIYAGDLDATLMRFARARKLDVERICAMIENTMKWRKENKIEQVLMFPLDGAKLSLIRRCKPASYIGFDRQGKPVYIDRMGKLDVKGMEAGGVKEEDIIRYHIQEMEFMGRILMKDTSERAGYTVDTVAMIMDVEGITLSSLTPAVKSLVKKIMSIDSDHYPETNGGTWIVNASFVFSTIWSFVKPFLDPRTRSKVQLLPKSEKTRQMLVEQFGRDLLPTFLGGNVDFKQCQEEWAARMDKCLAECARQYKETESLDISHVRLDGCSSSHMNGHALSMKERSNSLNALRPAGLPSLVVRQPSIVEDGADEFYTPRSTLSRASSTVSSMEVDLNGLVSPDSEARKGPVTPGELRSALQNLDGQQLQSTASSKDKTAGAAAAAAAAVTGAHLEPIITNASPRQHHEPLQQVEEDEELRDKEAQHAARCKCTIM